MLNIKNKNLINLIFAIIFTILSITFFVPHKVNAEICTLTDPEEFKGYCKNNFSNNNNYGNNYTNNNSYNNNYSNRINPAPFISSVNPVSVNINSNKIITIKGNNFVQSSIVKIDSETIATTFVDSGTLQATLSNITGERFVTVFNPIPGGGYSNAVSIMIKNIASVNTANNTSSKTNSTSSKIKNVSSATIIKDKTQNDTGTDQNVKELAAGAIFGYNAFMPSSLLQWIFFAILVLLAVILWRKLYVSNEEKHAPIKHA